MTENIEWEGFESDPEASETASQPSGKGLRAQVEKMAARIKAVEAENATLKQERSQAQVSEAVKTLGYAPEVASFYPAGQPTTPDAIASWLEKNQAVFAKLAVEPASTEGETKDDGEKPDESPVSEVPKSLEEMYRMLQDLEIAPPSGAKSILEKLQAADSEEEVMAIIDGGTQQ